MISACERGWSLTADDASARSAMIPPSPLLEARMMRMTYLSETTIISDQKIAERPPRMFSGFSAMPCTGLKVSLAAYSGLVPMSP